MKYKNPLNILVRNFNICVFSQNRREKENGAIWAQVEHEISVLATEEVDTNKRNISQNTNVQKSTTDQPLGRTKPKPRNPSVVIHSTLNFASNCVQTSYVDVLPSHDEFNLSESNQTFGQTHETSSMVAVGGWGPTYVFTR